MEIVELKPEYIDYVTGVIMNRWDVPKESALEEIDRWIYKKDNTICFVGLIDNKPMATGVFETYSTVDESIPCWNTLLWVEPKHRGFGYGSLMTKKRFQHAKELGIKTIYLDTVNAKNYHLKFGWEIVSEFDKNGEHYTIMKKDLQIKIDDLLNMQYELRQLLFCRPANVQDIESKAVKLCDAVVNYSEQI